MPLVTIYADKHFYITDPRRVTALPQKLTLRLADYLPGLISDRAEYLGLDPASTPVEGVQVDIQKFHGVAKNIPNIGIQVQIIEPYPSEFEARASTNEFIAMVSEWLSTKGEQLNVSVAVDLFWTPGHGCIMSGVPPQIGLSW